MLDENRQNDALTEQKEGHIDPFAPPKAGLLGMLFIILLMSIGKGITGWLPGSAMYCLASWIIISKKRASPEQVFRLNPVSPAVFAFPIALAVVFWSAEILLLEGIDLITRGWLHHWGHLFPSPLEGLHLSEIISACILVPIAEEMYWRGFFSHALRPLGTGWAVVLPAVFFALFHHPLGMAGAFSAGIMAGVLTARHGSILPGMVLHATGNAFTVLLALIKDRYGEGVGDALYYSIPVLGVLLALRIRPELARLWNDIRLVFRDFASRPAFGKNARLLFKHWSYILLVLQVAFTIATLVMIATGREPF